MKDLVLCILSGVGAVAGVTVLLFASQVGGNVNRGEAMSVTGGCLGTQVAACGGNGPGNKCPSVIHCDETGGVFLLQEIDCSWPFGGDVCSINPQDPEDVCGHVHTPVACGKTCEN